MKALCVAVGFLLAPPTIELVRQLGYFGLLQVLWIIRHYLAFIQHAVRQDIVIKNKLKLKYESAKPKPINFSTIKPKVNQARKFRILFAHVRRYQLEPAVNLAAAKLKTSMLMGQPPEITDSLRVLSLYYRIVTLCSFRFDRLMFA